eukprot:scaffold1072_cov118-Isochrysis_galbana.AAC.2
MYCTGIARPLSKISVEFSTKRKIALQLCKISDESTPPHPMPRATPVPPPRAYVEHKAQPPPTAVHT